MFYHPFIQTEPRHINPIVSQYGQEPVGHSLIAPVPANLALIAITLKKVATASTLVVLSTLARIIYSGESNS